MAKYKVTATFVIDTNEYANLSITDEEGIKQLALDILNGAADYPHASNRFDLNYRDESLSIDRLYEDR